MSFIIPWKAVSRWDASLAQNQLSCHRLQMFVRRFSFILWLSWQSRDYDVLSVNLYAVSFILGEISLFPRKKRAYNIKLCDRQSAE